MATEEEVNQVLSKELRELMAKGIVNHVNAMTKSLDAFMPKEEIKIPQIAQQTT